jgi:glucose/arabinose dehydrogenase
VEKSQQDFHEHEEEMMGKTCVRATVFASAMFTAFLPLPSALGQNSSFHNAPPSAGAAKNPSTNEASITAGGKLYSSNCLGCHGSKGAGSGNIPALAGGPTQKAKDGEIFWFISQGDLNNGMPSWKQLSEQERWQIVSFLKSPALAEGAPANSAPAATNAGPLIAPPPHAPFYDFRSEKPGNNHKITAKDLPKPTAPDVGRNYAQVVKRGQNDWPEAPAGFDVHLYATNLNGPRNIVTAPNGDFFVAESDGGDLKVFHGISAKSEPEKTETFAANLKQPYGIAFYPAGPDPKWLYVGQEAAVVRFPYKNGDLAAEGPAEHVVDLPHGTHHRTRSIQFSQDGSKLFVAVGSDSNIDDSDVHPNEKNRSDILTFNVDGSGMEIYASGIRNSGGGIAFDPKTGQLWASVNERDALGDDLVPDYITHIQQGGFYGWPWWYIGANQDPRYVGKHPELATKVIVPEVLLQAHSAPLELTFYEATQFPTQYRGDIFAALHGSWNRSVRVGYEVIRVPTHQTGKTTGEYEDFLTGFVRANGNVWGRPVGVTVAKDGSLLVTDDASNSIWRVSYHGK